MGDPAAASNSLKNQPDSTEKEEKSPNVVERAKEETEAILHQSAPHHHKETHGERDDIDEDTPVDEVRAPNVFGRIKEEVQAIAESILNKKESETHK